MILEPTHWAALKIVKENETFYKVLVSFENDKWAINGGITKVEKDGDYFLIYGYSKVVYRCHRKNYGLITSDKVYEETSGASVDIMPENTDWINLLEG